MTQTQSKASDFMNTKQISELFQVTPKTIHNWIAAGKFPGAFKLPGGKNTAFLVPTASVEAYKKERDQSSN